MNLRIRPAQTFDAAFAAPLIQEALGAIGWALTGTDNDEDAAHVIAQFFGLRGNRLSFTNVLIAEVGSLPAGLALAYDGAWARELDEPFRQHRASLGLTPEVVSEAEAGEFYLDTLATAAQMRGRGVGSALIAACGERARALGLPLTLLVEDGNPARKLYERSGFTQAGEREIAGHRYARMVRR